MIVRNLVLRHGKLNNHKPHSAIGPLLTLVPSGRQVVSPISRTCLRTLTTEPTTPPAPPTPQVQATSPPPSSASVAAQPVSYTKRKSAAQLANEEANAKIPENWTAKVQSRIANRSLGGTVEKRYNPDKEMDATTPDDATLELLMAAQAHMGHHTSLWNPENSRYIYGVRAGIHIISLETTLAHLRRAAAVVEEVAYAGGLILFVGTRKGQMPIVVQAAEMSKGCHLFKKWTPGSITNRDTILAGMELKIVDELDRPLPGFQQHLNERRPIVPDLVVCLNPLENYTMLHECGLAGVPTIGVIDTDADPTWVTYQIPANDDR
jgi:ribosomal protein S2